MRRLRAAAAFVAAAVVLAGLAGCAGTSAQPKAAASHPPVIGGVGVEMFQRPWTSIGAECGSTLGPAGFSWVLTSPPQEHITGSQWWTSYQPVSYAVDSKLGTEEQFADMVTACKAAGVRVVADAVINHMTAQGAGTGFAGTAFTKYAYPGLYTPKDFHHCALTPDGSIQDYTSRAQVQTCELVGLADLDTGSAHVRTTIAGYLKHLLGLGVAGFRIDAAKHMAAKDVAAIVKLLPAGTPVISEVIRGSGEAVQPEEYTRIGQVFEFQYARELGPQLKAGVLMDPTRIDEVPSKDAAVFVDNHDTERGDASVTYRDGSLYLMANALMLADDYGTPVIYSGYAFSDPDAGAPQGPDGRVIGWDCAGTTAPKATYADGEGVCTEAWKSIAGMIEWRTAAASAPREPGVSQGAAYGFERKGKAVIAANPGSKPETLSVPTSLKDGAYCDVIADGPSMKGCAGGATVLVSDGMARFELDAGQTAAIHIGAEPHN
ncbi:alpha-amylase [Microbacterium sp. ASV49]|uniref:Alpha-amylase n=1 Tax=Microbacterium candidum TaxID=3041922 RepID=A0ABT7N3G6_9MICO|nr:alpha-amylase family protein [Microbacterium sp. ASV49]MDL9981252.1 alpha-amylase family protein [Microbacterium sp. ASV49]